MARNWALRVGWVDSDFPLDVASAEVTNESW